MINESELSIEFPVMRVSQPIGEFFVGSMKAKDLVNISHFDVRQLTQQGNIDDYMGIQRKVDPKRVSEIAQYVRLPDSTFPTAVILAVQGRCAELIEVCREVEEGRFFRLRLTNYPGDLDHPETVLFRDIARVLDGQHRIRGLQDARIDLSAFEVNVAVFIEIDIADQAAIFSTVNLAQTKVNPSLVYDLKAYDKLRSPEKTAHFVTVALDQAELSPFFGKIKRLGVATEGRVGEFLSQSTVVRGILPYLSSDIGRDREYSKRERPWPEVGPNEAERLIFRRWFVAGQDDMIAQLMMNYFEAIRRRWPGAWGSDQRGMMLSRTNGYNGFMRFLRILYNKMAPDGGMVKMSAFSRFFESVSLRDEDFNSERYKPGTSGETALFKELVASVSGDSFV